MVFFYWREDIFDLALGYRELPFLIYPVAEFLSYFCTMLVRSIGMDGAPPSLSDKSSKSYSGT